MSSNYDGSGPEDLLHHASGSSSSASPPLLLRGLWPAVTATEAAKQLESAVDTAPSITTETLVEATADRIASVLTSRKSATLDRVRITVLIGCWEATPETFDLAQSACRSLARQDAVLADRAAHILFSGGDMFEICHCSPSTSTSDAGSTAPLVAEAVLTMLRVAAEYDQPRLHVAFQHAEHLNPASLYPTPTVYFTHSDVTPEGRVFYSGYTHQGRIGGALRNMLMVIRTLKERGFKVDTAAVFLGGGRVALSEAEALIDKGEGTTTHADDTDALPGDAWKLIFLPVSTAGYPGPGMPLTYVQQRLDAGLNQWTVRTQVPVGDFDDDANTVVLTLKTKKE